MRHRSTRRARALLLALALAAPGCGKDSTAPSPSAAGTWSGSAVRGTQAMGYSFYLYLYETARPDSLTGHGTISGVTTARLSIVGVFDPPNVTLTMHPDGFEDVLFTGELIGRRISGVVTGSGFEDDWLVLQRR